MNKEWKKVKEEMAALLLELLMVAVQSLGLGLTAMFPLAAPLIALLTLL